MVFFVIPDFVGDDFEIFEIQSCEPGAFFGAVRTTFAVEEIESDRLFKASGGRESSFGFIFFGIVSTSGLNFVFLAGDYRDVFFVVGSGDVFGDSRGALITDNFIFGGGRCIFYNTGSVN